MIRRIVAALITLSASCAGAQTSANSASPVAVFYEAAFPASDTPTPSAQDLHRAFPDAAFADSAHLPAALASARLLVLPYGSAYPEEDWDSIYSFLDRGGNLLAIGGKPFMRAAYREAGVWKLRPERNGAAERLLIPYYEDTPGSAGLTFSPNPDYSFLPITAFAWKRAFSPIFGLSQKMVNPRGGSSGTLDSRIDTLAWGVRQGRRLSAPVIQVDHLRNHFAGGRWILIPCELDADFFASSHDLLRSLANRASDGAEEFTVQPSMPVYTEMEQPELKFHWGRRVDLLPPARVELSVGRQQSAASFLRTVPLRSGEPNSDTTLVLPRPPVLEPGFYSVTAKLMIGDGVIEIYRTGFWYGSDPLDSGPRLTVNHDYFERDGKPMAVAGTTYMSSDVQRMFVAQPNPAVWDRDMAEMQSAGFNMLRTGLWSGWEQAAPEGAPTEFFLRTLEAFLRTARRHGLAVQFTFFAFMPDVFGGGNPYFDPEALRREKQYVSALAARFHDVPWLMWDLINEPSFDNPAKVWSTRPNGDAYEAAAWKEWLAKKYPNVAAFAAATNIPPPGSSDPMPLPKESDFALPNVYRAANHLAAHDFHIFAQDKFTEWVAAMRETIRATGSRQLITVGEDEGGVRDRPHPQFFAPAVDFTAMHMWWGTDTILWDALAAKAPGLPMLGQEIGVNHDKDVDGASRRTPEEKAGLLERKLAVSLGAGAGAIQWLWNVNGYMVEPVEISIGAVRVDGTEKPEAQVMRDFAAFAAKASPHLHGAVAPDVVILTSDAFQYSSFNPIAVDAQQKAVRALNYGCGIPASVMGENEIAKLGTPKLVIVPSPQALSDETWRRLLDYVTAGGRVLITGSMERDEHWVPTSRLAALGVNAPREPITLRESALRIGGRTIRVSYSQENQLHFDHLKTGTGGLAEFAHGKGMLWIAAEPLELAEGLEATTTVYAEILRRAGITPPFTGQPLPDGVLVRPLLLDDAVIYLMLNESSHAAEIDLRDKLTGAHLTLALPSGRGRLVLLNKKDGRVVARFGE